MVKITGTMFNTLTPSVDKLSIFQYIECEPFILIFQILWKILLESMRLKTLFPFQCCFLMYFFKGQFITQPKLSSLSNQIHLCVEPIASLRKCNIYGTQTKWATGNAHIIFQFSLEISMECYYIKPCEALIIFYFLNYGKF